MKVKALIPLFGAKRSLARYILPTLGSHRANGGFCRRFTDRGGSPAVRLQSAVGSIPAWRRRLSRVTILNMDAFEMLDRIEDSPHIAIYCDPPYFKCGARYTHSFTPEDHDRLAASLHRFRDARVVLSYYEHPRLAELYPDWSRQRIVVEKHLAHGGRRGKIESQGIEILLSNQSLPDIETPTFWSQP